MNAFRKILLSVMKITNESKNPKPTIYIYKLMATFNKKSSSVIFYYDYFLYLRKEKNQRQKPIILKNH